MASVVYHPVNVPHIWIAETVKSVLSNVARVKGNANLTMPVLQVRCV
jgi:hypothetical protein